MTVETAALEPVAEDLWIAREPVTILGMRLTATMTVVRLPDGGLLLYSPISPTSELRRAIDALGHVAHLFAPNLFHHLRIGDWAEIAPSARVHGPPGLSRKRPDLRIDRIHGAAPEPAFTGVLDEVRIEGFRLEECALLHRPTRTLLLADLVHNVGRPDQAWARLYTRMMGFHDRVALSRMIRWTGFSDRRAARRSIDHVLAMPFDRVIVGHGTPIEHGAREAMAAAFAWLPPAPARDRRPRAENRGESR